MSSMNAYDEELKSTEDLVSLAPEEIERIRSGKDSFTFMTDTTFDLIYGVANTVQSGLAKLSGRQCSNEDFRNLLQQFVENCRVVDEMKSTHGRLLKYVYPICSLTDCMVAIRFRDVPRKQYESDAEKFRSSLKSLRTRMENVVELELVSTSPSCLWFRLKTPHGY